MIVVQTNKYVVIATDTKEVISEHPYTDEYTRKKAMDAAKTSNDEWKESRVAQ